MPGSLPSLLGFTILLGLFHVLLAAELMTVSRGWKWNMSNRDGEAPPLSPAAARARRAAKNFLETFPLFAAALVCAIATSHDGHLAVLGAHLYFWARLAYLPVYVLGVPVIRTLVWAVALVGLLLVVFAIL
jgi:uncharacterized MAPEG superfamily protein